MKISKELLESIFNYKIKSVIIGDNETTFIPKDSDNTGMGGCNWGRYDTGNSFNYIRHNDLFVKCKQWALKHIIDKEIQSTGCIISSWTHPTGKGKARILVIDETFIADTEVEAVIKACEWILKNDEQRLL